VGTGKLHPALEECFGMESVVSILERAHEALVRNLAQIHICPEDEMKGDSGEGFSALAAMVSKKREEREREKSFTSASLYILAVCVTWIVRNRFV